MAKGHRSHDKRLRNENKDTRPSAKVSYARVSVTKACFVLDAIRVVLAKLYTLDRWHGCAGVSACGIAA